MGEEQKKHSRSCAFCLYEVLLAHFAEAHENCGNLCAGCVILRVQLAVGAVHDAVGNRPLHCVYSVAAYACSIGEVIQRTARGRRTGIAVQHGDELLTGDVYFRVGAIGHAVGLRPLHALLVPRRAAGGVLACVASENGHQHTASGGRIRGERIAAGAVHQTLVGDVCNRIRKPVRLIYIRKCFSGRLLCDFYEYRRNRYLACGHGKCIFAVALIGDADGAALGIGNGQLVKLIAVIGLDRNRDRAALGGVLRADSDRAVLGCARRGDGIAGLAAAALDDGRRYVIATVCVCVSGFALTVNSPLNGSQFLAVTVNVCLPFSSAIGLAVS